MKVVFLFPLVLKSVNLKMSEDETKDYLMVRCCFVSWFSADHNQRLSNKNLHLNSLCIYCFILISMTRKRRSGPWQKFEVNVLTGRQPYVHTNTDTLNQHPLSPIQIFECDNRIQGEIVDMVKKRFMENVGQSFSLYYVLCLSTIFV